MFYFTYITSCSSDFPVPETPLNIIQFLLRSLVRVLLHLYSAALVIATFGSKEEEKDKKEKKVEKQEKKKKKKKKWKNKRKRRKRKKGENEKEKEEK